MAPRTIVNSISLSRIGLALLFVFCFQKNAVLLYVSGIIWLVALGTDLLDGYLARHWNIASVQGRLCDSLGDKSIYSALIISFTAQGLLFPLLSWALIVREVALYVTRIIFPDKLINVEQIRRWTDSHGQFMHLTLLLGLAHMYLQTRGFGLSLFPYMQISAAIALVLGVASVFKYLNLEGAHSR